MSTTARQAQDDMLTIVKATATVLNLVVVYEATAGEKPAGDVAWLRPVLRHATGGQRSLGRNGIFDKTGTLWMQVFTPIGNGTGAALDIGDGLLNAFKGVSTEHCVWFRNHRLREIGPDGAFYNVNALVDFTY